MVKTRFLTLDDIKDTGLTGRDLFCCGVEKCDFRAENLADLRAHMLQCIPDNVEIGSNNIYDSISYYCMHCGPQKKPFSKPNFYIDHLKIHGLKRYCCVTCDAKFAELEQARSHMRAKHKFTSINLEPTDPSNPSDGLFIVHPNVS